METSDYKLIKVCCRGRRKVGGGKGEGVGWREEAGGRREEGEAEGRRQEGVGREEGEGSTVVLTGRTPRSILG